MKLIKLLHKNLNFLYILYTFICIFIDYRYIYYFEQEETGFNPFDSLRTIWTPTAPETLRTKRDD